MTLKDFDDDAVVISGISGRFPDCENINELIENLYNGKDCVSSDHRRWKFNDARVPARIGKMSQVNKFDNICFGIPARHAHFIDPAARLATEVAFEAITDAGINPVELRNTKTNVYGAMTLCESDKILFYEKIEQSGQNLIGSCRALISNRISYCLGLIGSSVTADSDNSSSGVTIQRAYEALKSDSCDYAIITTGITILHPQTSYHFSNLGLLSPDGINRSFDEKANGFTRSESVGVIFLQKAKHAKRIYAEVVNTITMYGDNVPRDTCLYPTAEFQAEIMKQTLTRCGLKPTDINYIEANGMADKSMDLEELKAIDLIYGKDRNPSNPLLIGSIKSNIGNTINSNLINSIIKVLIAMEKGVIPPNLHYNEPPKDAKCLQDGRVKVVTEPTPWVDGDYAALNTVSLNGVFSHVILKRHSKGKKKRDLRSNNMPRLYVISCRNQEMISSIFNVLQQNKGDDELSQLIHEITKKPFMHSLYSGYIIIPESEEAYSEQSIELIQDNVVRPIWFVFSGMGSQWTGMGESLMKIPVFAEAIKKCDAVLKPRGYDIVHIICDKDPEIYDNMINCFLGIAAIQIGLVDILYAVGVQPNYIIGHSVGELGCSYADGCFTAEEMILCALSRGLASIESELIHGTMAAIGLSYQQVKYLCPKDIDVACHNGPESSTISGPTESVNTFVEQLKSTGIFAKTVLTNNIAYHSRYIAPAGPKLLEYLNKVIPQPKKRSKRWISTSVPRNEWDLKKARFSSAEYHTNNLLNSVLFEEVLKMIPNNAVTIEISPHGLLQTILKTSLHRDIINLALTKRNHKDNTMVTLSALGKLYNLGYPITPEKLYPKISYPVSRGTPLISSHVKWEHSADWYVCFSINHTKQKIGERIYTLYLKSEKYKFLQDFQINDDVIISPAVYLKLVTNMYSKLILNTTGKSLTLRNIVIRNTLLKLPENGKISFRIMISAGSGTFEIISKEELIASGIIGLTETERKDISDIILQKEEKEILSKEDIYSYLLLRGYKYGKSYNIIRGLSRSCSNGTLECNNDWRLLLEGLIQVYIINSGNNKNILTPTKIEKLIIDVEQLKEQIQNNNVLPVKFEKIINMIACPGITMTGINFKEIVVDCRASEIVVNELKFIQNIKKTDIDDVILKEGEKLKRTVVVKNQQNCIDQLTICLRDSKYDNVIFLVNTITQNDVFEILEAIKREPGYKKLQIFDLQDSTVPKFSLQNEFYKSQIKLNLRENVLLPNGVWGTYRWTPLSMKSSTNSSRWQAKSDLSGSLEWMEELPLIKGQNDSVVKVKYASFDLNIYEHCLKNNLSLESQISVTEYSGTDEQGRRVMGLIDSFTISNEILSHPDLTWTIPDTLSFEEAATIPQAYFAAFCILHLDRHKSDQIKTVLIHYGASEVGQALINLSLSYNLDVYTTYETEEEKRIIESMQSRLPQSHIININEYKIYIKKITNNEGLDLVIANYSTLNDMESCLDIVKDRKYSVMIYDSKEIHYEPIPLGHFLRFISMHSYYLQNLFKLPQKRIRKIAELMRKALQAGTIKPIVSRRINLHGTTEETNIKACQRYGKVLVNLEEEKNVFNLIPQYYFRNDKCYFVVEGFNTFGKILIDWMIEQGVKKLFLVSNKTIQDHENWVLKWRDSGATVVIRDEVDTTSFNNLLKEAASLSEIEAIFDLQRTTMDSSINSLEYYKITKVLDKESRNLCSTNVKFFLFSSLDFQQDDLRDPIIEKLCYQRKESGLHGLFILLPNLILNTPMDAQSRNTYYIKMSLLLQRLSVLLSTDATVIAFHHQIQKNCDNIINLETIEEDDTIQVNPEQEMLQFEEYLRSAD